MIEKKKKIHRSSTSDVTKQATNIHWFTDKLLAVDTETTGLQIYNPEVVPTFASWWDHRDTGGGLRVIDGELIGSSTDISNLWARCLDPNWTKLFYNAKFDIPILRKCGIKICGPVIDVMVMAQMAIPREKPSDGHGLKKMTKRFFDDDYEESVKIRAWARKAGKGIGEAPDHLLFPYGIKDAKRTIDLFFFLKTFFDENEQWDTLRKEMLNTPMFLAMEEIGLQTAPDIIHDYLITTKSEARKIKSALCKLTDNPTFNPNAPMQVAKAVFHGGKGAPTPTQFGKSGPKTDKLALIEHPSPIGDLVIKWRGVAKTTGTYLNNFLTLADPNHVIHASINQNGARTGRLSCSDPNLTNLPRTSISILGRTRSCFVPRPGFAFLFGDYDQLEVRIQAHWTGEDHIIRAIRDGLDLHDETCRQILKKDPKDKVMRYIGKKLNLSMQYGTGVIRFVDTVLADSDGEIRIPLGVASVYIADYKSNHPNLQQFFITVADEVRDTGGVVNTYGRFMPVDPMTTYKGVNYKVQGTAADLVKERMRILFYDVLKPLKSRMVMQIHDEIMFEIHNSERWLAPVIREVMEEHTAFRVPLTVSLEWSPISWGSKKELLGV